VKIGVKDAMTIIRDDRPRKGIRFTRYQARGGALDA